jgi:hypothetical protein
MGKKTKTSGVGKTGRIEIRIDPDLRSFLAEYCEKNLQTTAEAVTHAIKELIGFGKPNPAKRQIIEDLSGSKKTERLEIRIHPRLEKELVKFKTENRIDNVSLVITEAIKQYIGYGRA